MNSNWNDTPELLPAEVIARAEKLEPALVSDGMKGTDIPGEGTMDAEIMPVDPSMKIVATAITVNTCNGDNFPIHYATYTTPPGYVMVIDGNDFTRKAYLGDLIAGAAKAVGFKGIVIDGYVRDYEGLKELGLPIFCKGFMQAGPIKKGPGQVNVPIHCGGVSVEPGDLVVAGADGVSVVPRARIDEILTNAEAKQRLDLAMQANIDAYNEAVSRGEEPPKLMPAWIEALI
ncbi:MAG: RraA family protein [Eubacteriales bacterium]|jgi:4-hydroxy-4-methyl-2-oxoglutarate aldolase|nr:RraA family protein [Eubacteriales bacterium]MDD6722201.1 RraA family protein [Clostridiales bacterium]MDY5693243.1 RraA family protein [Eubacteriales bacterium]HZK45735.1 RraA family protein [Clostridia bacterium]